MSDETAVTVASSSSSEHEHSDLEALHGAVEQAAMYLVAGLGLSANIVLLTTVLLQSHTRRLTSAFLVHACLLNCVLCAYCVVFGKGLQVGAVGASNCNSLGTSYIVLMTASVFNLVAAACCEVYLFDNCSTAVKKRPKGSLCCVLFGTVLVYTGSIILHLGPTLIGANFESSKTKRCLFIYGQVKNYIVYTMWILIVSLALAAAAYYLVVFHKVIGKTVQAKLIILSSQQEELSVSMDVVDHKLEVLAAIKRNRQRVLSAACGLHFVCWYPLFLLILVDPQYQVSTELYKLLTILGFARAALEPMVILAFDRSANHRLAACLPCTQAGLLSTEDEVNRWMLAVDAATAAASSAVAATAAAAAAGTSGNRAAVATPPPTDGADDNEDEGSKEEEERDRASSSSPAIVPHSFDHRGRQRKQQQPPRQLFHRYNRRSPPGSFDAPSPSFGRASPSFEGLAFSQQQPPPLPPPPQPQVGLPTDSAGMHQFGMPPLSQHYQHPVQHPEHTPEQPQQQFLHQHHFPAVPFHPQGGYTRTVAYSPITRV